jgi:hypothetical protein
MSDNWQVVTHYAGECITDYSKEQLIEIVIELGRALERERELHGKTIDAWGRFIQKRR